MSSRVSHFYEFGPFRLDEGERVLLRDGETVRLTPKEFETLLALVRNSGHLMTKGELLKEVWPDTFVEEATLAQNIFTLRKALGRGASEGEEQQYIETVPRRGYRFVAGVRESREEASDAPAILSEQDAASVEGNEKRNGAAETGSTLPRQSSAPHASNGNGVIGLGLKGALPTAEATSQQDERRGHPVRAAVLISLAAFLLFGGVVFLVFKFVVRRQAAPRQLSAFQSMEMTRLPVTGDAFEAVISPDGKYVAYLTNDAERWSIWIRQVSAHSNIQQLIPPAAEHFYGALSFSPDSEHLYYLARKAGDAFPTLNQVPVLGGTPKKVLDDINGRVAFAPDGQRIAFTRGTEEGQALLVANADGTGVRELVKHSRPEIFGAPAWSPDGQTIACVYGTPNDYDYSNAFLGVTAVAVSDGSERRVTPARWVGISQIAWLPDGAGIILSASERELSPSQIWRVAYPSGEVSRVTNDVNIYLGASITADASALVTVQTDRAPNIWVAPNGEATRAEQITSGTGKLDGIYGVSWTPDGRLVYASVASGNWDIWIMDADGKNQRQLTVDARSNYGPSVTADGRYIVFVSNRAGGPFNVWRMDIDGANLKQLTFGKGENFAHVTPDGKWVVYASISFAERNLIWKVPFDGGEPVAITDKPSSWPFVSPDGKWVACTYREEPDAPYKLAIVPFDGGPPTKLFDLGISFRANTVWLPDGRGIAYLDSRTGTPNIWLQPISGGKPMQLTDFKANGIVSYDWSRDNRLVATRSVESTGIVLIRNFEK